MLQTGVSFNHCKLILPLGEKSGKADVDISGLCC